MLLQMIRFSLLIVFHMNLKQEKTNEKHFAKAYAFQKANLFKSTGMSRLMALMFGAGYLEM